MDGTFLTHALQQKIYVKEQLAKMLEGSRQVNSKPRAQRPARMVYTHELICVICIDVFMYLYSI